MSPLHHSPSCATFLLTPFFYPFVPYVGFEVPADWSTFFCPASFPIIVTLPTGVAPWRWFTSFSLLPVAPTIEQLLEPQQNHHWCIPFGVTGNPKPELQWYHENKPLQEHDYIHTKIHKSVDNVDYGCLQLVNPTHIHNGLYRLVAKNEYGWDEKTVSAMFIDPPETGDNGLSFL